MSVKITLYSIDFYVVSPGLAPDDGRCGNVASPCSVPTKVGVAITADDKKRWTCSKCNYKSISIFLMIMKN